MPIGEANVAWANIGSVQSVKDLVDKVVASVVMFLVHSRLSNDNIRSFQLKPSLLSTLQNFIQGRWAMDSRFAMLSNVMWMVSSRYRAAQSVKLREKSLHVILILRASCSL